jgi:hypothetical protein
VQWLIANAMRMQWSAGLSPVHRLAPFGFQLLPARLVNGVVETSLFVPGSDVHGAAVAGNRMSTTERRARVSPARTTVCNAQLFTGMILAGPIADLELSRKGPLIWMELLENPRARRRTSCRRS